MHYLEENTAPEYLRINGCVAADEPITARELPGGVSNVVLLVTLPRRGERFVLKQARGRLRVKETWLCPVERIWREVEVLRICGALLRAGNWRAGGVSPPRPSDNALETCVPQVLWEDRQNFLFAMTAAPDGHRTWKDLLLAGETQASVGIAMACGQLLARLHATSWENAEIAARLDERAYFDQLRLDPYYRHVARVQPELAPHVERLIDSVWQHRRALVHGDFSPKNLLVSDGQVTLIDCEVGHCGDPAFDLGFFLTHLVLKSIWSGPRRSEYLRLATIFWDAYRDVLSPSVSPEELAALESRMLWNLAGCTLARVDGKSPMDYLNADQQDEARQLGRQWLAQPPLEWHEANGRLLGT